MSNSVLFQPFALHDLTLPNRIVLAPMTRSRAGIARLPNTLIAEYYCQRSSAGLLVTEATTISEEANGWNESPGVYTDEMTEGWKHTTEAVHEKGGVIFLQLWHLGRSSHSSFHGGKPAVAPSAIKINEPTIHTPTGKQPHEVGVPHGSATGVDLQRLFRQNIRLVGGVAPVRAYIPELLADVLAGKLDPSPDLDLTVDLAGVPEGYAAMDGRQATKVMVRL